MSTPSASDKELTSEEKAINKERIRIMTLILNESETMVTKYKKQMSYVGGMLSTSMSIAYAKGLSDAFKLITQENKDEMAKGQNEKES